MVEAIREDRIEAGAVSKETPLPIVSRVADALLGQIAGIGLDIVEGLGGVMEKVYERLDRNYGQYMEELRRVDLPIETVTRQGVFASAKKKLVKTALSGLGRNGYLNWFCNQVDMRLPGLISIEGITPEFTSRFIELTRQRFVPELYIGHFSHLDPVVASKLCQRLTGMAAESGLGENLKGFVVTLARSVPEGQQSDFMRMMYRKMEAFVNQRGVEFVPVTRRQDVERYNLSQGYSEKRPLVAKLRQRGIGALILSGGSVQPGRHPKGASRDQIYGLQEVKGTELLEVFNVMERLGRRIDQKTYFLPAAVSGTYRLFSSDSLLPTPEGLISLYDRLSRLLELFGFQRMSIVIKPGMPLTNEDMVGHLGSNWRNNPREATFFLMQQAAQLNLPHERGFYGGHK